MELHVLAGSDVTLAARELVRNASQLAHLPRGQHPAWYFSTDHLNVGLALAVNPAPKAISAELIVSKLPGEESFGLGPEQFDVGPNRAIVFLFRDLRGC
jgi:hypothetical protein